MASNDSARIASLTSQLQVLIQETQGNEDARKQLCSAAKDAVAQLEPTAEVTWRLMFAAQTPAALMTLMEAGAIDRLASASRPMSADELAAPNNADPLLFVRLLRPLTALGYVQEVGENLYSPTAVTKSLSDPVVKGGIIFQYASATHSLAQMPTYLRQNGYQNVEHSPGPFQHAHQTSSDMYQWLSARPDLLSNFNTLMTGHRLKREDWFSRLDVNALLLDGARKDDDVVLLVDIGGNVGHDVAAFHRAFPHAPGKLILQDSPAVIGSITQLDESIEKQNHDYFSPQPVVGARAYYLRSILLNLSTGNSLKVLQRVRDAMTRGYSKLLINEFVLPATGTPLYPAVLDINMMALLNGMERTVKQWNALLDEAGLKIIKIHGDPSGETECLIEAELK